MQKAEAQHSQENQPAARQQKGDALESPQSERIAQLDAMAESSPQVDRLTQLAAAANNSPSMAAQRKAINAIHNSPNVMAQRRQLDGFAGETAQREEAPAKPNNTGLPDNLKSGIESLSGMSMDNVKVHYNSSHPAQLNALAYAQGTDIHVAPGQEKHLPHEAWHVVQQAQGRVRPTMQMKGGVPVNDEQSLEQESDVMGAKAARDGVAQRKPIESATVDRVQLGKGAVAQLSIQCDEPDKEESNGRAKKVAVENIRGTPYSEGHNNPTIDAVFGWQQLHAAGHTLGNTGENNSHYNAVRMHLWNGRLDGPGNKTWNLAPGPAWVNSSMSAGPEMSAKLAVDGGYWIWLDTRVSYASDNTDANDFRNVIPNRMEMQWGYMVDEDDQEFSGLFNLNKPLHKGDAVGGTWSADIDQPAGAMTEQLRGEYDALEADDTDGLEEKFGTASNQEKAQAFHIVKEGLKKYILDRHHAVFYVMGEDSKAKILSSLEEGDASGLTRKIYGDFGLAGITNQVFQPLIAGGDTARLQYLFCSIDDAGDKRMLLIQSKGDLANALGVVADDMFFEDYTLFKYLTTEQQWQKVSNASVLKLNTLFEAVGNMTQLSSLFDEWASLNGCETATSRVSFIELNFKAEPLRNFVNAYRKKLKYALDNELQRRGPRRSGRLVKDQEVVAKYIYVKAKNSGKIIRKKNPEWNSYY